MFIMNICLKTFKYCWLVILFAGWSVCYADKVVLSNGGSFEGLIVKDTPQYVVLDLGTGSMNLERRYISSVKYSGTAEREEIKRQWQKKYFLNKKFIPVGHEDIVKEFRKLLLQRDVASRSAGALRASKRKKERYVKEIELLKDKYAVANVKLKDTNKEADMLRYNELVRRVNSLVADINVKVGQIEKFSSSSGKLTAVISSYLSELAAFETKLHALKASLPSGSGGDIQFFYDRLLEKVVEYNNEFSKDIIVSKQRGRSTLVTVIVNDRATGTFILDTGAELVSMTKEFAGRLGINMKSLPILDITVADGRKVKGFSVVLGSVRLGSSSSKNVPAVILPSEARSDYDGLLGMSFLRDYIVQLDGTSGTLVLRRLDIK